MEKTVHVIEARDLTKKYNGITAVDVICLSIEQGSCFGLLGPNGAGKTIVLTTHYMEEAEKLCDTVVIMDQEK